MKYWSDKIICSQHFSNSCRTTPFRIAVYQFDYSTTEDKVLIDNLLQEAKNLASKVYSGAANDSVSSRSRERIYANCIAGVISEYCWKHYLNYEKEVVRPTPFESASNQIDLEVISNQKKIEVRSSFPRNGVEFAICHPTKEFDILGPYSNAYKPGEVLKDYFIRTLFPMSKPTDIIELVKSRNFMLYLTGGATKEMMFDPSLSKEKTFIPEDNFTIQTASLYKVVPFHNALDCGQIYHLIKGEI